MLLSQLLKGIQAVSPHADRDISHLTLDSREIRSGSLFIAVSGSQTDGKKFIASAIERGAVAILSDEAVPNMSVPILVMPHLKQQIGEIAANFYDHPAKKLQMIGVTGTNGKTSIAHFIAQALSELNIPCGLMGSLGRGFFGQLVESDINTPDAINLQATLAQFVNTRARCAVMEVSSHGIDQHRVDAIPFEMGIFTNLTQDHLDYHGTMEKYAAVKRHFLTSPQVKQVILNVDDEYGNEWARDLQHSKPTYCYSLKPLSENPFNVFVRDVQTSLSGIKARIHSPWGEGELKVPLLGHFNLSNVLAVFTALNLLKIPFHDVLNRLAKLKSVPGRMQLLRHAQFPLVVVDHSHSPDSLAKALQVLREYTKQKLICVFGCGGDRDRGKRPKMAAIVEQYADVVIVTSDNPRSEDPHAIIEEILMGFVDKKHALIEVDRSNAILKSIQLATTDDCILIAGKGAERYQLFANKKIPFNDAEKVISLFESSWVDSN